MNEEEVKVEVEVDLPANSYKQKASETSEKKVVKKVVIEEVVEEKPGFRKLMRDIFSGENLAAISSFIATSVILPGLKNMIYDAGTKGLERALFDEDDTSRTSGKRFGGGPIDYQYISTKKHRGGELRALSPRESTQDTKVWILQSRGEAEGVLDNLRSLIDQYGSASVADYYEMLGRTGSYTDNKWGWTSLGSARIERVRNGFVIDLPRAVVI